MNLDRVLAQKKILSDLAVAHASGYQFKDPKLAVRDAGHDGSNCLLRAHLSGTAISGPLPYSSLRIF
jgi:hypothetical protein